MLVILSPYDGLDAFRLIPAITHSPYREGVYDPYSRTLILVRALPCLGDDGRYECPAEFISSRGEIAQWLQASVYNYPRYATKLTQLLAA